MNLSKYIIIFIFAFFGLGFYQSALAQHSHEESDQDTLRGIVLEKPDENSQPTPIEGATVFLLENPQSGTYTDPEGKFQLLYHSHDPALKLVVRYVGYTPDTIEISRKEIRSKELTLTLKTNVNLKTVEIVAKSGGTIISSLDPRKVEILTKEEFTKAACCNLSESFETNASVDVSYQDAVTGVKEISMLGLSGVYTQITKGNQPSIRGLGRPYGFNYIPGIWLNSVQISKGAGSVANGYESLTGQINIELLPPDNMERLILNVYGNSRGRTEANVVVGQQLNKHISSGLFVHGSQLSHKFDDNKDSFIDLPNYRQLNIANNWNLNFINPLTKKGIEGQFGAQIVDDRITGGQMDFNKKNDPNLPNAPYGITINTSRGELYSKTGYILNSEKGRSIGLQLMGIYHKQDGMYGKKLYNGLEYNFNANLIFQTDLDPEKKHILRTGTSYMFDQFKQKLTNNSIDSAHTLPRIQDFERRESVPGIFAEYTYKPNARWTFVGGVRTDFHNLYGTFFTPRFNMRWGITDHLILRIAAGRGFRVVNIYPENSNLLTSAREIYQPEALRPEVAWNYGISVTQKWTILQREATLSVDFYRTDFENQIIVDLDRSPTEAWVYNLDYNKTLKPGGISASYANSLQIQWNQEVLENFFVRLAYKYYDVNNSYSGNLVERWMINRNRFFSNFAYEWKKFKFDFTFSYNGAKRLPNTMSSPDQFKRSSFSPGYPIMNAQITYLYKKWEFYFGGENIGNYTQSDPITAAREPNSPYFDTSYVWGPVFGSVYYLGLKWKIEKK